MPDTTSRSVRCADCGYLAVRENVTWTLWEAEQEFRDDLQSPSNISGLANAQPRSFGGAPLCFVGETDFAIEPGGTEQDKKARRLALLSKDRSCDSFIEWKRGFTPKEHMEMNLLLEQRKWQRDTAREDQKWRAQQADQERQWRERQAEKERQWRQEDIDRERDDRKEDMAMAKQALATNVRTALLAAFLGFLGALAAVALSYLLRAGG